MKHEGSLESTKDESSFLSAFQTSLVLHTSMNVQLTTEAIALWHFQRGSLNVEKKILEAFVSWQVGVHNGNMKHARAIEFDYANLLAVIKNLDLK